MHTNRAWKKKEEFFELLKVKLFPSSSEENNVLWILMSAKSFAEYVRRFRLSCMYLICMWKHLKRAIQFNDFKVVD